MIAADDDFDHATLSQPRIFLIRMVVFLLVVGILATVLYPQMSAAFLNNPGLNGFILAVLAFGIGHSFMQVLRLFPEVNWVSEVRLADPGREVAHRPRLLAPMAALLRGREGLTMLSPLSMRSLLDSLAARLDESRDLSRYLIGLLIFLGLLGTFWGLLDTVSSVSAAIRGLDITSSESSSIFEELKSGLEAPLRGMGTSFSSSMFGLASSLVLGFLDLQTNQAQNRFYNELENWLSSITDLAAGDPSTSATAAATVPLTLHKDMRELQRGIERMNRTLEQAVADSATGPTAETTDTLALTRLADAVQSLVQQMREEQKVVRQWAQGQSDQQLEIRKILTRLSQPSSSSPPSSPPSTATRPRLREE